MREGGRQRIDGGIDAKLRERTREHRGRVEVSKGGCGRRVGKVIGGYVDGLHRRDRTLFGGGDALLQFTHLGGEVRLVADGGRHTAEQRGDLGTGLREAEDVVNKQQRVGAFLVAEVFRNGSAR